MGLHNALARMFRSATAPERLGVLQAHPDLAGKLAAAKRLTPESTAEQAAAALDALTDAERQTFQDLNAAYVAKHGFPFIIAVRDNTKASILAAFHARIPHNVVVREIRGGVSGIPALDAARRLAEAELGAPPRLFSLWPADLYAALKSSTEAALRQASIAPETVRAAHVQLQMAGNRSFTLRLTKTHRT